MKATATITTTKKVVLPNVCPMPLAAWGKRLSDPRFSRPFAVDCSAIMRLMVTVVASLALLSSAALADPWPLERQDRYGTAMALTGLAASDYSSPWRQFELGDGFISSHGPSLDASGKGYFGRWVDNTVRRFDVESGVITGTFAAGNFVVVWSQRSELDDEDQSFVSSNVQAQRFDVTGAEIGDQITVGEDPSAIHDFTSTDVAMDADGDLVVAWTVFRNEMQPETYEINFQGSEVYTRRVAADDPFTTLVWSGS